MTVTPLPTDAELKDLIERLREADEHPWLGNQRSELFGMAANAIERISPQVGEDVIDDAAKTIAGALDLDWETGPRSLLRDAALASHKIFFAATRLLSSPREDEPIKHTKEKSVKRNPKYVLANAQDLCDKARSGDAPVAVQDGKWHVNIERSQLEQLLAMAKSAEPFAFHSSPDKFKSEDGGCTETVICDEHVQAVREAFCL